MIFNLQLAESSNVYLVVNVIMKEAKYILPSGKFINIPSEVALALKNALNQGRIVSIKKELVDNPKSKDIPLNDFVIEDPTTLNMKKSAARARVYSRISAFTALLTAYDMFEFYVITAKLISMGYNIFNENEKEETYIKIIETGDEDLISDLERYLEIKDIFDKMMKKHRGLKTYFIEINECETEEELEDVIKSNKGWLVN